MTARTIGSLCSGIGGLELGLEHATGGRTVWQCEIDPDARRVLAAHWPIPCHDDVRNLPDLPPVDVLMLLSSPKLSLIGALDLVPKRWAQLAVDLAWGGRPRP